MSDFDQFWASFPRKTAKFAAMKAFTKARKVATLDEILEGVERYRAVKPAYADFCHPATWLNHGRWMDEPDRQVRASRDRSCPHQPPCLSPGNWQCQQRTVLEKGRAS